MKQATLVYCVQNGSILLGMKKRGFGKGKLNGYGGKAHEGENMAAAAIRELQEEANLIASEVNLEKAAEIDFHFIDVPEESGWGQTVHVYLLKEWKGEPEETEEMKPEWYN
ncbi:MAG: NUDIX domain-containing protein, partial [Nanoarchaeota archaeon]|nr:NUDIX domain-containing protein [Nanoarchaeota archaeon]